jgi:hyperosmotically inducible protein
MRTKILGGRIFAGWIAAMSMSSILAAHMPPSATPPSPSAIEQSVHHALAMIPYGTVFDDVSYRIEDGTVTLLGAVTRPVIKDYAEKAVQGLPGVTAVNDQIEVLPLSPFDDQIRVRTLQALTRTGSLYRYFMGTSPSIRIVVKNGHVTLDGVVQNAMDSQLAYMTANQVSGVFSVTNGLRLEVRR